MEGCLRIGWHALFANIAARKQPNTLRFLLTLVVIVGILYAAKAVIVPLSLAVLLAFVLTPLVEAAQRRGLGRVPAVLGVVLATLIIFALVGWGVGNQVSNLSEELPAHTGQIRAQNGSPAQLRQRIIFTFRRCLPRDDG